MKTIISILMLLITTQSYAATDERTEFIDDVKQKMSDSSVGQDLSLSEIVGHYQGQCANEFYLNKEALYVDTYTDIHGRKSITPISTLQFYSGYSMPSALEFLLAPTAESRSVVEDFVRRGLTGTDNNLPLLHTGPDFSYKYPTALSADGKTLTLKPTKAPACTSKNGFCNPPILVGCEYGRVNGVYAYQNCFKQNDQTVFKKLVDGSLISHRTADSIGTRTNNYSFFIPAESVYCRWTKN